MFPAKTCDELYKSGKTTSGVYTIDPDGHGSFQVRCEMDAKLGRGWIVFQQRQDGSVDFNRNWTDYKIGFGNLNGEHWLGLEKIHRLSASGQNVLRVDLESFENETAYAVYGQFSIGDESDAYRLHVDEYTGTQNPINPQRCCFSSPATLVFKTTRPVENSFSEKLHLSQNSIRLKFSV